MRPHAQLTREAEADLAEAFDYYEAQLPGLGHEFVATVEHQLERVVENPAQYQVLHRGVRRAVVRRFPTQSLIWPKEKPSSSWLLRTKPGTQSTGSNGYDL